MKMQARNRSAFKLVLILLVLLIGVRPSSSFAQMMEYPGELEWLSFVSSSLKRQPELILLEEGRSSISFSLTTPGIYVSRQKLGLDDFTVLKAEGFTPSNIIGQPNIPVIRKLIAVPSDVDLNFTYSSISEIELYLSDFGYTDPVAPVQACSEKCGVSNLNSFNNNAANSSYPDYINQDVITILDDFIIHGQRYILCEINPISYNPTQNSIIVLPQIEVTLSWDYPGAINSPDSNTSRSQHLQSTISDHILNPLIFNERATFSNIGYLIITPDVFETVLSPFVSLKQSQGFSVTIATLNQIGSTSTQIKSYIQDAYDNWQIPPTYLLLVGDSQNNSLSIPAWTGAISGRVTDLYYSTTEGNDNIPDILVGRLPARNIEQLDNMIEKILTYEMLSGEEEWIKKAAFLATGDSTNYWIPELTHNTLINAFTSQLEYSGSFPFDPQNGGDKLYAQSYLANNTDVVHAINDERSLIIFSGHGNSVAWGTPGLSQANIRAISTSNALSFVTSFACETGNFDVVESFGETWMIQENKGAIAFIGASGSSYWGPDDTLERNLFEPFFSNTDFPPSIGQMLLSGLMGVHTTYPGNFIGGSEYYFEIYNLQGDPSLQILNGLKKVDSIHKIEVKSINNPTGYEPGETVIRSIMVTNLGNEEEYVSISISGNLWQVNFLNEANFSLVQNEEKIIHLEVSIPISADVFDRDVAFLSVMTGADSQTPRAISIFSLSTLTGYRTYLPATVNH